MLPEGHGRLVIADEDYAFIHGIILRVRPARSARKYAKIWTKDGSPLLWHSVRQRSLLTGLAGERLKAAGLPADFLAVEVGMRYGSPSVGSALGRLRAAAFPVTLK